MSSVYPGLSQRAQAGAAEQRITHQTSLQQQLILWEEPRTAMGGHSPSSRSYRRLITK